MYCSLWCNFHFSNTLQNINYSVTLTGLQGPKMPDLTCTLHWSLQWQWRKLYYLPPSHISCPLRPVSCLCCALGLAEWWWWNWFGPLHLHHITPDQLHWTVVAQVTSLSHSSSQFGPPSSYWQSAPHMSSAHNVFSLGWVPVTVSVRSCNQDHLNLTLWHWDRCYCVRSLVWCVLNKNQHLQLFILL